jgi:hypothetical protein
MEQGGLLDCLPRREHDRRVIDGRSIVILLAGVLVIAVGLMLPTESAKRLSAEGAIIETVSAALLGVSLLACMRELARRRSWPWLSGSMVVLMLLLRELDFHRRFTPRSIDSTGFYRSAEIPLHTRLIVPLLALPFLLASLHILWLGLRRLAAAVRARQPWPCYTALAFAMIGVARYAEKSRRDLTHVVEEVAEVAFAAFVLLVVLSLRGSRPAARRTRSRGR